jgi:hypothetical protein
MKKQKSEDRIHRRGAEGAEKGTRLKEKSKKEKCLNKTWLFEPFKLFASLPAREISRLFYLGRLCLPREMCKLFNWGGEK